MAASLQMIAAKVVSDHLPLSVQGKAGQLALLPLSLLKRLLGRTLIVGARLDPVLRGPWQRPVIKRRYTLGQWLMAWGELLSALSLSSPTFCANLDLCGSPSLHARLLPYLSNLTALQLSAKACTDATLYNLAKVGRLQALAVSGSRVSAEGLKLLCCGRPSETLKALDISGCFNIDDEAALYIEQLTALRWLNVSSTALTEGGVLSIVKALRSSPAWLGSGPQEAGAGEEEETKSGEHDAGGLEYLSAMDIPMARGSLFVLSRSVETLLQLDRDACRSLRALAASMQGGWAGEYRSRVDELLADESGEFPGMEAVVDVGDASAGWGQSVAPLFSATGWPPR